MEKTIKELEQELIELKSLHEATYSIYGSELCAGDMIAEEEKLKSKIIEVKRLMTLREEAIEKWRMLGLLDGIDENSITIQVKAKVGVDEIKK